MVKEHRLRLDEKEKRTSQLSVASSYLFFFRWASLLGLWMPGCHFSRRGGPCCRLKLSPAYIMCVHACTHTSTHSIPQENLIPIWWLPGKGVAGSFLSLLFGDHCGYFSSIKTLSSRSILLGVPRPTGRGNSTSSEYRLHSLLSPLEDSWLCYFPARPKLNGD